MLGVLLSIGVTVGMGIGGPWWARVGGGLAATAALTLIVKAGTSSGRGPLPRLANWIIGSSNDG